jgi:phenylalanyl-tRNA synthetase beta subunit
MNYKVREAVYAAMEKKVEAHLKYIHELIGEPITHEQIKQALKEAMDLLRQPIYH